VDMQGFRGNDSAYHPRFCGRKDFCLLLRNKNYQKCFEGYICVLFAGNSSLLSKFQDYMVFNDVLCHGLRSGLLELFKQKQEKGIVVATILID
jgi:hypothetical protein